MERCTHMRWRPIVFGLLLSIPVALGLMIAVALAQEVTPTPPDDRDFRELICRMAVGNIAGHNQPMLELYRDREAVTKTKGAYGLFTGFYSGSRGWSGHGPTLDDPAAPRYLKNGDQFTNGDAARLRAITAEFRQRACDELPTPQ